MLMHKGGSLYQALRHARAEQLLHFATAVGQLRYMGPSNALDTSMDVKGA